jgi:DNA-binding SARP family transcriptional activator
VVVSPSGTASRLRIRLCGGLAVEDAGERLEGRLPSRQARIVFACLVDHRGHPISRAGLAEALWGDHPPPARDIGLRAVLSGVRRVLGPDSVKGRGELRLMLPDDVWIDVEVAAWHVHRAERALEERRYDSARHDAGEAADILQDELLPGCGGPWAEERRVELEELGRHAREIEGRAALADGDPAAAERSARRLGERAPYRESAHALVMEALAAQGNVAEALLVYDRLVRALRDDLGTAPTPALAALHERLLVDGRGTTRELRRRPRRGARARLAGMGLALAGLTVLGVGLAGSGTKEPPARHDVRALPMQQAVLPGLQVAFDYPKGWPLRRPADGLAGAGAGDAFCNIFRTRGAAPPKHAPAAIVRYARRRLGAWARRAPGVKLGSVGAIHAVGGRGATAVERDHSYGVPEAGRMTFFAAGRDLVRIECSAAPHRFATLDRAAFRPLVQSFRTLDG